MHIFILLEVPEPIVLVVEVGVERDFNDLVAFRLKPTPSQTIVPNQRLSRTRGHGEGNLNGGFDQYVGIKI